MKKLTKKCHILTSQRKTSKIKILAAMKADTGEKLKVNKPFKFPLELIVKELCKIHGQIKTNSRFGWGKLKYAHV